jgi:hypothetical protein
MMIAQCARWSAAKRELLHTVSGMRNGVAHSPHLDALHGLVYLLRLRHLLRSDCRRRCLLLIVRSLRCRRRYPLRPRESEAEEQRLARHVRVRTRRDALDQTTSEQRRKRRGPHAEESRDRVRRTLRRIGRRGLSREREREREAERASRLSTSAAASAR